MKHVAVFVSLVVLGLGIWALVDKEGMLRWMNRNTGEVYFVLSIAIIVGACVVVAVSRAKGSGYGSEGGCGG